MTKYHLSTPQQNIWNLQSFYSESAIANICGAVFLNAPLKEPILGNAINEFIKNNTAVRMIIENQNNIKINEHVNLIFDEWDLSDMTNPEIDKKISDYSQIPLSKMGNLFEFIIIKRKSDWGLYTKISHLVSDAWSMSLMVKDIFDNYLSTLAGEEYSPIVSDYTNFYTSEQEYIDSKRYGKDYDFFDRIFSEKPKLLSFRKSSSKDSINAKRKTFVLSSKVTHKIKTFTESLNIAPGVLFESALAIYMHRYFEEDKIIIGMPVLNRSNIIEKQTMGMFISTMPLVLDLKPKAKAIDVIRTVEDAHFNTFKHQRFPITEINKLLKTKHDYTDRIFDATVSYQNARVKLEHDIEIEDKWYFNGSSETALVIHIMDFLDDGKFLLNFDYLTDVFSATEINYLNRRLLTIIDEMISNQEQLISDIKIMDQEEYNLIVNEFNNTKFKYDDTLTVVDLFNKAVIKTPDKIALIFEDKKYTYAQLDLITNSVANYLIKQGIKHGERVALLTKRSDYTIFGMIGTIKAGAAYMPLDINYPDDRINYLLQEANVKFILGYEHNYRNNDYKMVDFSELNFNKLNNKKVNINIKPDDTYCILHTSGSTGRPKAIELLHSSFVNIYSTKKDWLKGVDNVVSLTAITFDLFRLDSIFPLVNSKTAILTSEEELNSVSKLESILVNHKNILVVAVPTKMLLYLNRSSNPKNFKNIVRYLIGGEVFPKRLYQLINKINKDAEVINGYGPAEATLFASYRKVDNTHFNIGRPLPNYQIYILKNRSELLPFGFQGEICISGKGLAKGYTNEELTTKSFIHFKDKAYCTGDMGMYDQDGQLHLLGRVDNQVKIRGLRIELEEVEEQIKQIQGITNSVCLVKSSKDDHQYLYAFYTSSADISQNEIRAKLLQILPQYMIPNYFIKLEELPVNFNGKIDRSKLVVPDEIITEKRTIVKPKTKTEEKLYTLVTKMMGLKELSILDNLFEYGLDSLSSIDLLNVIESELKVHIKIRDIFNNPTIKDLSGAIDSNMTANTEKPTLKIDNINVNSNLNKNQEYLITGANGYLGAHLLNELLADKQNKINVLVRSEPRFRRAFKFYFDSDYEKYSKQINIYTTDITKENLGLDTESYNDLKARIKVIIHAAANVKHFGQMSDFYDINVNSTLNLLKLAGEINADFNYISTISVSGAGMARQTKENIVFSEESLDVGQVITDNVYLHTKYLSEYAIHKYIDAGLRANIFRVGNLSERYSDGKFQINAGDNGLKIRIKAIEKLGILPIDFENILLDMSYVDKVSKAIILLIQDSNFQTYHVFNQGLLTVKEHLNTYKIRYKPVGIEEFVEKIKSTTDPDIKTFGLYMQYIQDYKKAKMQTVNYKTQELLEKLKFKWEE